MSRKREQRPRPTLKILHPVTITERMEGSGEEVTVVKPLGEAFCDLLEYGHDPEDVCEELGVTPRSYYAWRAQGQDAAAILAEGGRDLTEAEEVYLHFLQSSTRARGALRRKLERRIHDLVPEMEPREATDVLARLAKLKWSKASTMKLDVAGELNVVEHHGAAVSRLLRCVTDSLIAMAPKAAAAKMREALPEIVQSALGEVVAPEKEARDPARSPSG